MIWSEAQVTVVSQLSISSEPISIRYLSTRHNIYLKRHINILPGSRAQQCPWGLEESQRRRNVSKDLKSYYMAHASEFDWCEIYSKHVMNENAYCLFTELDFSFGYFFLTQVGVPLLFRIESRDCLILGTFGSSGS